MSSSQDVKEDTSENDELQHAVKDGEGEDDDNDEDDDEEGDDDGDDDDTADNLDDEEDDEMTTATASSVGSLGQEEVKEKKKKISKKSKSSTSSSTTGEKKKKKKKSASSTSSSTTSKKKKKKVSSSSKSKKEKSSKSESDSKIKVVPEEELQQKPPDADEYVPLKGDADADANSNAPKVSAWQRLQMAASAPQADLAPSNSRSNSPTRRVLSRQNSGTSTGSDDSADLSQTFDDKYGTSSGRSSPTVPMSAAGRALLRKSKWQADNEREEEQQQQQKRTLTAADKRAMRRERLRREREAHLSKAEPQKSSSTLTSTSATVPSLATKESPAQGPAGGWFTELAVDDVVVKPKSTRKSLHDSLSGSKSSGSDKKFDGDQSASSVLSGWDSEDGVASPTTIKSRWDITKRNDKGKMESSATTAPKDASANKQAAESSTTNATTNANVPVSSEPPSGDSSRPSIVKSLSGNLEKLKEKKRSLESFSQPKVREGLVKSMSARFGLSLSDHSPGKTLLEQSASLGMDSVHSDKPGLVRGLSGRFERALSDHRPRYDRAMSHRLSTTSEDFVKPGLVKSLSGKLSQPTETPNQSITPQPRLVKSSSSSGKSTEQQPKQEKTAAAAAAPPAKPKLGLLAAKLQADAEAAKKNDMDSSGHSKKSKTSRSSRLGRNRRAKMSWVRQPSERQLEAKALKLGFVKDPETPTAESKATVAGASSPAPDTNVANNPLVKSFASKFGNKSNDNEASEKARSNWGGLGLQVVMKNQQEREEAEKSSATKPPGDAASDVELSPNTAKTLAQGFDSGRPSVRGSVYLSSETLHKLSAEFGVGFDDDDDDNDDDVAADKTSAKDGIPAPPLAADTPTRRTSKALLERTELFEQFSSGSKSGAPKALPTSKKNDSDDDDGDEFIEEEIIEEEYSVDSNDSGDEFAEESSDDESDSSPGFPEAPPLFDGDDVPTRRGSMGSVTEKASYFASPKEEAPKRLSDSSIDPNALQIDPPVRRNSAGGISEKVKMFSSSPHLGFSPKPLTPQEYQKRTAAAAIAEKMKMLEDDHKKTPVPVNRKVAYDSGDSVAGTEVTAGTDDTSIATINETFVQNRAAFEKFFAKKDPENEFIVDEAQKLEWAANLTARKYLRHRAATIIQALARGFLRRKKDYEKMVQTLKWLQKYKQLEEELGGFDDVDDLVPSVADRSKALAEQMLSSESRSPRPAIEASSIEDRQKMFSFKYDSETESEDEGPSKMSRKKSRHTMAAIKIQALGRGYLCRKVDYKAMMYAVKWLQEYRMVEANTPSLSVSYYDDKKPQSGVSSSSAAPAKGGKESTARSAKPLSKFAEVQMKRYNAAVTIQKHIRGHITRKMDRSAMKNALKWIRAYQETLGEGEEVEIVYDAPNVSDLARTLDLLGDFKKGDQKKKSWKPKSKDSQPIAPDKTTTDKKVGGGSGRSDLSDYNEDEPADKVKVNKLVSTFAWLQKNQEASKKKISLDGKDDSIEAGGPGLTERGTRVYYSNTITSGGVPRPKEEPTNDDLVSLWKYMEAEVLDTPEKKAKYLYDASIQAGGDGPGQNRKNNEDGMPPNVNDLVGLWSFLEGNNMDMNQLKRGTDKKDDAKAKNKSSDSGDKGENSDDDDDDDDDDQPSLKDMINYYNFGRRMYMEGGESYQLDSTDKESASPTTKTNFLESPSHLNMMSTLCWMQQQGIDLDTVRAQDLAPIEAPKSVDNVVKAEAPTSDEVKDTMGWLLSRGFVSRGPAGSISEDAPLEADDGVVEVIAQIADRKGPPTATEMANALAWLQMQNPSSTAAATEEKKKEDKQAQKKSDMYNWLARRGFGKSSGRAANAASKTGSSDTSDSNTDDGDSGASSNGKDDQPNSGPDMYSWLAKQGYGKNIGKSSSQDSTKVATKSASAMPEHPTRNYSFSDMDDWLAKYSAGKNSEGASPDNISSNGPSSKADARKASSKDMLYALSWLQKQGLSLDKISSGTGDDEIEKALASIPDNNTTSAPPNVASKKAPAKSDLSNTMSWLFSNGYFTNQKTGSSNHMDDDEAVEAIESLLGRTDAPTKAEVQDALGWLQLRDIGKSAADLVEAEEKGETPAKGVNNPKADMYKWLSMRGYGKNGAASGGGSSNDNTSDSNPSGGDGSEPSSGSGSGPDMYSWLAKQGYGMNVSKTAASSSSSSSSTGPKGSETSKSGANPEAPREMYSFDDMSDWLAKYSSSNSDSGVAPDSNNATSSNTENKEEAPKSSKDMLYTLSWLQKQGYSLNKISSGTGDDEIEKAVSGIAEEKKEPASPNAALNKAPVKKDLGDTMKWLYSNGFLKEGASNDSEAQEKVTQEAIEGVSNRKDAPSQAEVKDALGWLQLRGIGKAAVEMEKAEKAWAAGNKDIAPPQADMFSWLAQQGYGKGRETPKKSNDSGTTSSDGNSNSTGKSGPSDDDMYDWLAKYGASKANQSNSRPGGAAKTSKNTGGSSSDFTRPPIVKKQYSFSDMDDWLAKYSAGGGSDGGSDDSPSDQGGADTNQSNKTPRASDMLYSLSWLQKQGYSLDKISNGEEESLTDSKDNEKPTDKVEIGTKTTSTMEMLDALTWLESNPSKSPSKTDAAEGNSSSAEPSTKDMFDALKFLESRGIKATKKATTSAAPNKSSLPSSKDASKALDWLQKAAPDAKEKDFQDMQRSMHWLEKREIVEKKNPPAATNSRAISKPPSDADMENALKYMQRKTPSTKAKSNSSARLDDSANLDDSFALGSSGNLNSSSRDFSASTNQMSSTLDWLNQKGIKVTPKNNKRQSIFESSIRSLKKDLPNLDNGSDSEDEIQLSTKASKRGSLARTKRDKMMDYMLGAPSTNEVSQAMSWLERRKMKALVDQYQREKEGEQKNAVSTPQKQSIFDRKAAELDSVAKEVSSDHMNKALSMLQKRESASGTKPATQIGKGDVKSIAATTAAASTTTSKPQEEKPKPKIRGRITKVPNEKKPIPQYDRDYIIALHWIKTKNAESIEDSAYFWQLDSTLPAKPGQKPEDRAKEFARAMKFRESGNKSNSDATKRKSKVGSEADNKTKKDIKKDKKKETQSPKRTSKKTLGGEGFLSPKKSKPPLGSSELFSPKKAKASVVGSESPKKTKATVSDSSMFSPKKVKKSVSKDDPAGEKKKKSKKDSSSASTSTSKSKTTKKKKYKKLPLADSDIDLISEMKSNLTSTEQEDYDNCLAWLAYNRSSKYKDDDTFKDAEYFKKIDSILPKKPNQPLSHRAKEMTKALEWVRKAPAAQGKRNSLAGKKSPGGKKSTVPTPKVEVDQKQVEEMKENLTPEEQTDFDKVLEWLVNGRKGNYDDVEYYKKVDNILPKKPNQPLPHRAKEMVKALEWVRKSVTVQAQKSTIAQAAETKETKKKNSNKKDKSSKSSKWNKVKSVVPSIATDRDTEKALKWLEKGKKGVTEDAMEFKKIDLMLPKKEGQSNEERATEIAKALKFLRKKGVDKGDSYESDLVEDMKEATAEEDYENALAWVKVKAKGGSVDDLPDTAYFAKLDGMLSKKPNQKAEDRAKEMVKMLEWLRKKGLTLPSQSKRSSISKTKTELDAEAKEYDIANALLYIETKEEGKSVDHLVDSEYFIKLDRMVPKKTGQSNEKRAKEMVKMLAYLRSKGMISKKKT